MKKHTLILAFVLMFVYVSIDFGNNEFHNAEIDYFPLQVGNTWRYLYREGRGPYKEESLWKVTGTKDIKVNGTMRKYYLIEGNELSEPLKIYLRKISENEIMVYYDGQEWLHYKLYAKPGQEEWNTYDGRIGVLAAKDRVVETPAGKFSYCFEFCFYIPGVTDVELYDYLASNIGIVKRSYSWFSSLELVGAVIDGIQYGETPVEHAGRLATTWGNIKSRWSMNLL